MKDYYRYWGKAKKDASVEGPDYHLLPYHCLDVAAVGHNLLDPESALTQGLAKQLNVEPEWLRSWFTFCLILHDLGKFFRAFQNLAPNISEKLVPADLRCIYTKRHDTLGFALWVDLVKLIDDAIPSPYAVKVKPWLELVCGHHGKPVESFRGFRSCLLEEDELAAELFIRDVIAQWMPELGPLKNIPQKGVQQASWQLAGLAVVADWLGSNQSIFSYTTDVHELKDYWEELALPRAGIALKQSGLSKPPVRPFDSIRQQFDFIEHATPLQQCTQTLAMPESPQLFILEDVTGAGKTEAAMVLVHRLMAKGLASGVYVGLPTMATANALYQRMADSYQKLYCEGFTPSLVLAHGASQLSKSFQDTVVLPEQLSDKNYKKGEQSASAYCNQWLADSRKKALLADVGVGTIDQALLGVLPARHQALRLYGLASKVLLVDEVHAFDPYMRCLLSALLTAHAAQGGSVILLSATLPLNYRQELVAAFAKGAGIEPPLINNQASYPWLTQFSQQKLVETPVDTRASVKREVVVKRIDNTACAIDTIKAAIAQGKCICWIRNTVDDARLAFEALQGLDGMDHSKLTLFHSRYAMIDRQVIEQDVLSRFGKTSTSSERAGQVLVATQVVEQSLDLDFDIMITDLAPIDLIIQRAGRLQRHTRCESGNIAEVEQREKPCLWVLAPNPEKVADACWLRDVLPGTQAVYANVGQLWLTLDVLLANNGFHMPGHARALIEGVYGGEAQTRVPAVLDDVSQQALAEQKAEAGIGQFNLLKLEKGYCEKSALHNGGWSEEVNIPTRLGGDTVTCVLLTRHNSSWQAYAGNGTHRWALSQINLPHKQWLQAQALISKTVAQELDAFKESEPSLKWLELLPLEGLINDCYGAKQGWRIEKLEENA